MDDQKQQRLTSLSWSDDVYNNLVFQRKILILLNFLLALAIIICLIWMQITLGNDKVEPFVVEIDKKTGVATTVTPVTVKEYSANIAVLRALVIQYIRAREEYIFQTYDSNFQMVKALSNAAIFRSYATSYGSANPTSPYSVFGKNGTISVKWKSIIFPEQNTAQVRITLQTLDATNSVKQVDKIVLMSFEFKPDANVSESERLINPLGFNVTMYKIEDENPNI